MEHQGRIVPDHLTCLLLLVQMRDYFGRLFVVLEQVVPRMRRTGEVGLFRLFQRDQLRRAHFHALADLLPLFRHENVSYRYFSGRKLSGDYGRPKRLRKPLKVYVLEQVLRLGLQDLNDSVKFCLPLNGLLVRHKLDVVRRRLLCRLRGLLLLRRIYSLQYGRDRKPHGLLLLRHGSNRVGIKY